MYQGRGASRESVYAPDVLEAGGGPILGPGDYYAPTAEIAKTYGDAVTQHQVALTNPLIIDSTKKWQDLVYGAKAGHLDTGNSLRYTDPAGLPGASARVQAWLRERGHDGVVVEIPKNTDVNAQGESIKRLREAFGHSQVIKFGPEAPPRPPAPPDVKPTLPPRFEATPEGMQGVLGGTPAPAMPQRALKASVAEGEKSLADFEGAVARAQRALRDLGPEPPKPSPEARRFGARGREGADPADVARYDAEGKAHAAWRRRYAILKRAEVQASNALHEGKNQQAEGR